MVNSSSNWQDSINHRLVHRLTRPLRQPGMMQMAMSQRIINRCDRFLNRLPLLNQQMQRWGKTNTLSSEYVPIVFAQPISLSQEQGIEGQGENFQPTVSQDNNSLPLIQRKIDSSQALPVQTEDRTINVQNSIDLPSSSFYDETNPFLSSETQANPSTTSSAEIPIVAPQTTSEELAETEQMPLQARIRDAEIASVNPSPLNLNPPSLSNKDEISTINSSSEIPLVSSQTISEGLTDKEQMVLPDKLRDSEIAIVNPSPLNPNSPSLSNKDETNTTNSTSTSPSEIPLVSPQPISEELVQNEALSLVPEIKTISEQPASISPARQKSSLSSSSIPVVNPLNNLVIPTQKQQDNDYLDKSGSIKNKNLEVQIYSPKVPIVTVKSLDSSVNLTDESISFSSKTANYQNQFPNIDKSQINRSNSDQNIGRLPIVPVTSQINSKLKSQSLPLLLAKNTPLPNNINQKANLSNQNPMLSNANSASSTKIISHSSFPTDSSVTSMANQSNSNIDLDTIASQVERKLMRRLVIESERRGKIR